MAAPPAGAVPLTASANIRREAEVRSLKRCAVRVPALALVLVALNFTSVVAQITSVSSFEAYESGTRGVARIVVDGALAADGIRMDLPQGWEVESADLWSPAVGLLAADLRFDDRPSSVVISVHRRESVTLLVTFRASEVATEGDVLLAPVLETESGPWSVMSEAVRVRASTREMSVTARAADNKVASFSGGEAIAIGTGPARLSPDQAHTVSFWVRTTATDELVLSDWSGEDFESYGMELMVSPDGSLAYYRGFPGRHVSMNSRAMVADGRWHHVAVTHDPSGGWTRVYLDGTAADSLRTSSLWHVSHDRIVLGGRAADATLHSVDDGRPGFTGQIDDVAFWSRALDERAIQRQLSEPASSQDADFLVDFEDEEWSKRISVVSERVDRRDPIRHLTTQIVAGTVELSWESSDARTDAFAVDRSSDGTAFEEIGRLSPLDGVAGRFVYVDRSVVDEVAYYRVRQKFSSGGSFTSPTIKIGVADVMETPGIEETAIAVSNFPNPFRVSTSIRYEVPEDGRVQLSVWDLSGQPIATLVDETMAAGSYETDFDGSDLSAGTYFVRLQLGARIGSHKLLLVR